jgi:GNAT superfamily N-acetyltransferase
MAPGWTLPAYRNRGAHAALIAQSINTAADAGCEWITASYPASIEDRTRSYERTGFKLLYMRSLFRPERSSLVPVGVTPREPQGRK